MRDGKCGEDRGGWTNQEELPPLTALCAQQIAGSLDCGLRALECAEHVLEIFVITLPRYLYT